VSEYDSHADDVFFSELKAGCLGLIVGVIAGICFGILIGWWMQ
jgi:ABC-type nitrate/sulfonate/bicarbonate transport system permease component